VATLNDLAKRMRKKAKEVPEMGNNLAIKVTMQIVQDLAHVTPVDESTAISNWQVELNSPVQSAIRAYYPGSKGSTYSLSAAATIDDARAALANKKPGQPIYLSNVLRYITRLNEGSSTQAPAGYVERSVLLGRLVVRGKV
jgi:hypothetical protein